MHCPTCRHDRGALRRRLRRYSDLLAKDTPTRKDLMFLVDDGAYLLARGVLRNLNHLGRVKNTAAERIPEYPGTTVLAEALSRALAAQRRATRI